MRVISGTARGTKLDSIDNLATRPTLDRVKEALFNILQPYLADAKVLDLFAGSGALGIEALSRGAKQCVFCDKSYTCLKMLRQNIEHTHFMNKSEVIEKDYKKCLEQLAGRKFDIIFIDPPYSMNIGVEACKKIWKNQLLSKEGIIILETDDKEREQKEINELQEIEGLNLEVYDVRKYGRVKLMFLHERG